MRRLFGLMLVAATATAHGGSVRTPPPPNTIPVVPFGSGGDGPVTPRDLPGRPSSGGDEPAPHTWRDWWAYNAEYLIATRVFRRTVTPRRDGGAGPQRPDRERVEPVLLRALEDKSHGVRAAAAIALGKIGHASYLRPLLRHAKFPGEGWYDVREAALYAVGMLGDQANRPWALAIAADDDRPIRERSLALFPLLTDGSGRSADSLVFHLEYRRSGSVARPDVLPRRAEEERRRFAAHLLGFVSDHDVDRALWRAVTATKRSNDGVRCFAVTALARRGARDYRNDLFRMARDREEDRHVRRSAVIGLGGLIAPDEAEAIDRLAAIVTGDRRDEVRRHFAVMALGRIGGQRALDRLLGFARDRVFADDAGRSFTDLAIGLAGEKSPGARAYLLARFRKASSAGRRAPLAVALALARHVEAAGDIRAELERTSLAAGAEFLAYGSLALGMLGGGGGSGDTIREILRKYADPVVRREAAVGLALLEREAALPDLMALLRGTGTNFTRAAVVSALGMLRDASDATVEALIDTAFDDSYDDSVRSRAISALGALADPRAVPFSALLVRGTNYLVRCHALDEIATWL